MSNVAGVVRSALVSIWGGIGWQIIALLLLVVAVWAGIEIYKGIKG